MREYFGEALILEKNEAGEADSYVSLYLKSHGRINARARSARKIKSKLSAHLEPGVISNVRIVENKGFQVVDALKIKNSNLTPLELHHIGRLLAVEDLDEKLFQYFTADKIIWTDVLERLGWDSKHASCHTCGRRNSLCFTHRAHEFHCIACVESFHLDPLDVVYI